MVKFFRNKETKEVMMVLSDEQPKENEVELKANDTDAAQEKHVPVITLDGKNVHVAVGEVEHPMTEPHYIMFIVLVTDKKAEMKKLTPTDKPAADFQLADGEKVVAAYEYCNLHGLWVKKM
jgi:superoxide reductase